MILTYDQPGHEATVGFAKVGVAPYLLFSKFSELISRDRHIPPAEETNVGEEVGHTTREDYKDRRIWLPGSQLIKQALGIALVPAMMTQDGQYFVDVYDYGF
ncbi:MAG TPA: hypothetical protein VJB06_02115, partial [archaeon]|nr:hypothetical protein [archaeon]